MPDDLDLLQGLWSVTALEADGQATPRDALGDARIVIKGSRFITTGMGAVYEGTLKLDASQQPRWIDMKFDAGPEKGNTNRGIYELAGDRWTLCLATRGSARPASFAAPAGSSFALETLVRAEVAPPVESKGAARAPKAAPTPGGPATEFEGEWSLVSMVTSGKALEASMVQWVKRINAGKITTVTAGPQTMMKAEFTYNPAASPKTIDYLNLAGSNKGKTQAGIYEFESGLLKYCMAAPGAARPAEFLSNPGDGRILSIWKKP